jgi:hypothetical protein
MTVLDILANLAVTDCVLGGNRGFVVLVFGFDVGGCYLMISYFRLQQ